MRFSGYRWIQCFRTLSYRLTILSCRTATPMMVVDSLAETQFIPKFAKAASYCITLDRAQCYSLLLPLDPWPSSLSVSADHTDLTEFIQTRRILWGPPSKGVATVSSRFRSSAPSSQWDNGDENDLPGQLPEQLTPLGLECAKLSRQFALSLYSADISSRPRSGIDSRSITNQPLLQIFR